MKKRAQVGIAIKFLLGLVVAVIFIVALMSFFDVGGSEERDSALGLLTLDAKLRYYEESNQANILDDEILFSLPKESIIIGFNSDWEVGEERHAECFYSFSVDLEFKEEEEQGATTKFPVKKPEMCGEKSCLCLCDKDVTGGWPFKKISECGTCFLYKGLLFHAREGKYTCNGVPAIDSRLMNDDPAPFSVKIEYEGNNIYFS